MLELETIGRERVVTDRMGFEYAGPAHPKGRNARAPLHKRPWKLDLQKYQNEFEPTEVTNDDFSNVKDSLRPGTPSAMASRHAIAEKIAARRALTNASPSQKGASMEYQFPPLPSDTADRERRYDQGERVDPAVAFIHGYESRPLLHGWRPFRSDVHAPDPVLEREPGLYNPNFRQGGPFYGRYVGPQSRDPNPGVPLTPVDKAAYVHDAEYAEIYQRYQYSEFEYGLSFASSVGLQDSGLVEYFGWAGNATSLDPAMQLELGWSDAKLIGGSWYNIGEGVSNNFYSGGAGQRTFWTDLAWSGAITMLYSRILMFRLGMAAVGLGFQLLRGFANVFSSLGQTVGGDVGKAIGWIGTAANSVLDLAARVISVGAMVAFTYNVVVGAVEGAVVGGVIYVGGKIVEGIGSAVEWAGDRVGCFITEAVVRTTNEPDDGPTLTLLRRFRDEYVAAHPEGRRLLLTYLERAPEIVRAIEREGDNQVWKDIRRAWIEPAISAIRSGNKDLALSYYIDMTIQLANRYGASVEYDGSRHHWKRDPRHVLT
ncbi:hypothetical protein E0H36_05320 [Rhizobium leguminosarum bv. viciae]|uniref:hypothetical protein n=1 Tax=Rhizobium leguminosarum TaxID=384 RepID=UPI0010DD2698|nr:hypothetical protein [Rhizobium leguminosarum]TBZ36443.1 hypothetical protein E0H36_05320 [Rhizobium leguminosarum bv. viciae]